MEENIDIVYSESIQYKCHEMEKDLDYLLLLCADSNEFGSNVGIFSSDNEVSKNHRISQIEKSLEDLQKSLDEMKRLQANWFGVRLAKKEV